jgi:hypothetical protein
MRKIQLWRVGKFGDSGMKAIPVDELADTETERRFEDLLVSSPDLLIHGLRLVARQLPTEGGPLDLVGVDPNGRLTVFELKRGTLTRDAVAQVLDYASDLARMDPDDLAELVKQHSGRGGIEPIEDFLDWFRAGFPEVEEPLSASPRMVLVGLGADDRATRVVNFLASSGVEIQMLTFHVFRSNGELFIGRQVESVATKPAADRGASKAANLKTLLENASALGVRDFLQLVADFIEERLQCYRWPGKTSFTFSLQARTNEGRPTWRNYLTLYLTKKHQKSVLLTLADRTAQTASGAVENLRTAVPELHNSALSGVAYEIPISVESWPQVRPQLERFLSELSNAAKESLVAAGSTSASALADSTM